MLNVVRQRIKEGKPTHFILNIKVAGEPDANRANKIRGALFDKINLKPQQYTVSVTDGGPVMPVNIKWESVNKESSAYYWLDNPFYTDIVIMCHTKVMLANIIRDLKSRSFPGDWGITFLVTKPLVPVQQIQGAEADVFIQ